MLVGKAAPLALYSCRLLRRAPKLLRQAMQMSQPHDVQLRCRPEAMTQTSSRLSDSQASTSHACRDSLSPRDRDGRSPAAPGAGVQTVGLPQSLGDKQALSTFP